MAPNICGLKICKEFLAKLAVCDNVLWKFNEISEVSTVKDFNSTLKLEKKVLWKVLLCLNVLSQDTQKLYYENLDPHVKSGC